MNPSYFIRLSVKQQFDTGKQTEDIVICIFIGTKNDTISRRMIYSRQSLTVVISFQQLSLDQTEEHQFVQSKMLQNVHYTYKPSVNSFHNNLLSYTHFCLLSLDRMKLWKIVENVSKKSSSQNSIPLKSWKHNKKN